jgi:2-keto-4-pentenoate hydratase/2-oxohepta-3-ene-1,7-dioic acid hydratase in catechol pathway
MVPRVSLEATAGYDLWTTMRLITYDLGDDVTRAGLVAREGPAARVLDLGAVAGKPIPDLRALVAAHPDLALEALFQRLLPLEAEAVRVGAPLADVRLLAPVPRPPKVTCVGLNYRDHAAEQGAKLPEAPLLFGKARTAVTGPRGPIRIESLAERVDYEVELCLVVGRAGFRVPRARAREHLLGYTVACDVSDRAAQYGDKQWYRGKSFPTFCPTGPVLVTADALDPGALRLTTHLNGARLQDGTTADLIFSVDDIIAYVSAATPLEAGDLILTGTPAGVGVFRKPPIFLKAGDRLECAIEGIGALELPIETAR